MFLILQKHGEDLYVIPQRKPHPGPYDTVDAAKRAIKSYFDLWLEEERESAFTIFALAPIEHSTIERA